MLRTRLRSGAGEPARRARRFPRPPAPLAALLIAATLLSVAWSLVVPPFQGPDEDAHIAYTQRMVETRTLPRTVEPGRSGFSSELQSAQKWGGLYELPTNPALRPHASTAEREAFEREVDRMTSDARADGTGAQAANVNPPLYYAYTSLAYVAGLPGDLFTRIQLMRLLGIPLLLLTVIMTWLLAAELLPRPAWARTVAAGVVAIHPQLGFMAGVVNPDIALAAVWTTFFWLAVRTVRRGLTVRSAVGLGLLAAASALIQPRGISLALPVAFTLLAALLHHRVAWRDAVRPVAACGGIVLAGAVAYWWFSRVEGGASATGQIVGTGTFNPKQFASYLWQFYFPPWRFLEPLPGNILGFRYVYVESFFGQYGSLDVFLPGWVLSRLYTASLWGLVALALCLVLRGAALRRHRAVVAVLVVGAATYLFGLHYAAYNTLVGTGGLSSVLVGRYLLPLIALMGLAIAFVVTSLPGRWSRYGALLTLCAGVVLSFAALGQTFARYYA